MMRRTLLAMTSEQCFGLYWCFDVIHGKVNIMAAGLVVSDPVLPQKRRVPKHFENRSKPTEFHSTPKDFGREVYYESLNLFV